MICEIISFLTETIANIFIGFFAILKTVSILLILKYLLFIIPVYVFIQRIHNQTQQRALKSISEELVKINDFLIEFIAKIKTLDTSEDIDSKTSAELIILKSKINAHLIYMSEYINAFPYGGPLNYLCYYTFKRYIFPKPKSTIDSLEMMYQDAILNDTVLSLEKDLLDGKKLKMLDEYTIPLNQKTIDTSVSISRSLLENLEENTRKML